MRVRVVDDLEIIEIDEQYLLKSDTLDRFCVVNRSGFDLVSMLQKESGLIAIPKETNAIVTDFLREMTRFVVLLVMTVCFRET